MQDTGPQGLHLPTPAIYRHFSLAGTVTSRCIAGFSYCSVYAPRGTKGWVLLGVLSSVCFPFSTPLQINRSNRKVIVSQIELTLIAGLASEARMALALIRSHTVSVLTGRLTHSCWGRIQKGRDRSVQCSSAELVPHQDDRALNPTVSIFSQPLGCKLCVYSTLEQ